MPRFRLSRTTVCRTFFINVVDNQGLGADMSPDGFGYTVFGKVSSGMEAVDKIRAVPVTDRGMHANVPETPILILKASVETKK